MHTNSNPTMTTGRLINWAHSYDLAIRLLSFGKAETLRNQLLEYADLPSNSVVLDIGCGTGDLCRMAKARWTNSTVVGIDPAPEMIEFARNQANQAGLTIDFQVQPAEHLAFADRSFDAVFSSFMMHHLPDDLKIAVLTEVRRVLRPNGRLAILDFQRPTNQRMRTLSALLFHQDLATGTQDLPQMLQNAGFNVIQQQSTRHGMFGFVMAVNHRA